MSIGTAPFVVMAKAAGPVCNLDCGYCYYLGKKDLFRRGEHFRMSPEVLAAYVSAFIAASPGPRVPFVWHGGEPTLAGLGFYRRVVELQREYLPAGWTALNNLQTNGTLLDDAWCEFLAGNGFTVGISIDGPARLHDAGRPDRRGLPTHERVLRGFRLLREHGIDPDVLCAINSENAGYPRDVYRYFLDLGVRWLQFLPVVARGAAGDLDPVSVTPEAMGEFLCTVFDEWVRHDVARIGVQNFLECLLVVGGAEANLCVMAETCGRALAVEHDGSVYSCDHFVDPAHRLGNLTTAGAAALIAGPAQESFGLAKRDALPAICRGCPVRFLCHGGCPKDRFAVGPAGEPGWNYLCQGYRRSYSHILPLIERMTGLIQAGRSLDTIMTELAGDEREERRRWQAAGRNDPCPCGSGAKYKNCCLPTRRR